MSADFLLHVMREKIQSGEWAPGTKLPTERALAEKYRMGRNTIRHALGELESRGLIYRQVGRGTFVADRTPDEASGAMDASIVNPAELMEARLLIEPLLAGLVVYRASQVELDDIRTIVARSRHGERW